MLYVSVLVITVIYILYWYFTRTFNYWKKRNVVTPDPVPLFGNTMDLTLRRKFIGTYAKELYDRYPNEKVVGFYRMTTPCLLIRDVDLIKQIMIKDFDYFANRSAELSQDGLGANLFSAGVETWRVLRSKFSPTFTSGKLKNMLPLIIERSEKFLKDFTQINKQSTESDAQGIARSFTMTTIAACAFGLDLDYHDPNMKILQKLDKLILETNYFKEFLLMYPALLKKFTNFIIPPEVTNFFYDLVKTVFKQRNFKPSSRNDFMDLIMEMKQQKVIRSNKTVDESEISVELTDGMIAAQAFVFYFAGFETSTTTLGYVLYELTKYPKIQDKLVKEIDTYLEKTNGKIEYDGLMEMPYMAKVLDETLRKYPIVDPLTRVAQTDYKIPGTDFTISKGDMMYISAAGLHYDEKLFPNPDEFDPERFAPENAGDRHSCAYLPFGIGPRNCIGMRFAKVQSRVFLVTLLSKFRVEACANTRVSKKLFSNPTRALLGPVDPIMVNIVPRTGK